MESTLIGVHASYSAITGYTLLSVLSGMVVAACATCFDLGPDHAALVATGVLLGWEVFEYWMHPATGYWHCRNAANTACDIASGLWGFVAVYGNYGSNPYTQGLLLGMGLLAGASVQFMKACPPAPVPRRSRALECIRAARTRIGGADELQQYHFALRKARRARRSAPLDETDYASIETTLTQLREHKFPYVLGPYHPLTVAHWFLVALCVVTVVGITVAQNVAAAPLGLASAALGFALPSPSHPTMAVQDDRTDNDILQNTPMQC